MSFADSNRVRLSLARESTFGTLPSPFDRTIQRITSTSFAASKETAVSNELRSDAMVSDMAETGFSSGGSFGIELSFGGSFDQLFESALRGTYTTAVDETGAFVVVAAAKTLTLTGAFTDVSAGQYIYISGATVSSGVNNGWWRVATKSSADEVILHDPNGNLADETMPGTANVKGKMLRNGIQSHSYSVEQFFSDASVAQTFVGQRVGDLSLSISAGSIVSGSIGFQGSNVTVATSANAGTVTDATTTAVVNATSNVARILQDDTSFNCKVRSVSFNLSNALRTQNAIGNKYPCGIGYGRQSVSGSIEIYFEDETMYQKMLDHADVELEFGFEDSAGNAIHFYIPRIKFGASNPGAQGIDQDVMENIDWQAIANSAGTFQCQVDIA